MKLRFLLVLLLLTIMPKVWAAFPVETGTVTVPITVTHTTLALVATPKAPSISSSSPLGATVAGLQGVWSDTSTFTGSFIFVAPNYDMNGTYVVNGANLIISPNGPGVGSAGGTVEHATMEAVQLAPTADLVTSTAPNGVPLATSAGVWSWGPVFDSRLSGGCNSSDYVLYLNGTLEGCGTLIEVAHSGQLYVTNTGAQWFLWNGTAFAGSSAP
jgi:hypothetical protein